MGRRYFAVYCDAVATFEKAIQLVDKAVLVRGSYQSLKRNPALQVARDTAQTIRLFAQEFGLTPSARSQLKSPLAEPDGLGPERFFSGL